MVSSVLFGAGLIFVLTLPVLSADAGFWISVVVGASFILAAPIAWWIAPRLRARPQSPPFAEEPNPPPPPPPKRRTSRKPRRRRGEPMRVPSGILQCDNAPAEADAPTAQSR